jgi:hypothetical protein
VHSSRSFGGSPLSLGLATPPEQKSHRNKSRESGPCGAVPTGGPFVPVHASVAYVDAVTDTEKSAVWILGAGFSRSLGGPMLLDLLAPPTSNAVFALYGKTVATEEANRIRETYLDRGPAASPGMRFWSDPEAFLDELDAAAYRPNGPASRRLGGAFGYSDPGDFKEFCVQMRDEARRLVAAACCAFLKDADTTEERWQPYLSWAKALKPSDSVLTFNYDRVLEHLGEPAQPPMGPVASKSWIRALSTRTQTSRE